MTQLQSPDTNPQGHSAAVRLTLRLPDRAIRLGQVGPTWFRCREPLTIPPGRATLEIEVDGSLDATEIIIEPTDAPSCRYEYDLHD
ncbi:MAG: hypothetical protein Q9O74_10300 [Planctomycetota bacterium]|nr:hypothetical protein [Planctomycetota bacterium]